MTYYIYEVPGIKNGATYDWTLRSRQNFKKYQIESTIIETIEGPDTEDTWQVVGDREWELADANGYPRGHHYRTIRTRAIKGHIKMKESGYFGSKEAYDNLQIGIRMITKIPKSKYSEIIQKRKYMKVRELAEEYNVNIRTIFRILKA
tara:strand:- start:299 stop:742 length:444 start_codon:yes stop_codon:yes gene_type:complete